MTDTASGDPFQTQRQLRQLLLDAGLAPRKRHGQHFLIDRNLMMKLLEAADLSPADCAVEVGAGTGSLTALLAERAGAVVAVEIDEPLAGLARDRLSRFDNVRLLQGDALERKSVVSRSLLREVQDAAKQTGGPIKLVANLPYDIATPLVVNLLIGRPRFERLCFTVQAEVADRFLAAPGTSDYGPVGIITQVMAVAERICKAPPQAFWPPPKVRSTMVVLRTRQESRVSAADAAQFALFVRRFFQHRRQTLAHIAKGMEATDRILEAMSRLGLDAKARPEAVTPEQWVEFHRLAC